MVCQQRIVLFRWRDALLQVSLHQVASGCFLPEPRTSSQQNKRKGTGYRIDSPLPGVCSVCAQGLIPSSQSKTYFGPWRFSRAREGGKREQSTSFLVKNNCPTNYALVCAFQRSGKRDRISSLKYVHFSIKRTRAKLPVCHLLYFHLQRLKNQRDELEPA